VDSKIKKATEQSVALEKLIEQNQLSGWNEADECLTKKISEEAG